MSNTIGSNKKKSILTKRIAQLEQLVSYNHIQIERLITALTMTNEQAKMVEDNKKI